MPDTRIVVISVEELEKLVVSAVRQAIGSRTGGALLVDKQDLARQLSCSAAHIDHLRKRGLPWVPVGQTVRFEPAKVLDWLRQRPAEPSSHRKRKPTR
ncbi:MAG TPA: hypothetical protein VJU61_02580 [Polyangiaceae bacterium]|nr:hypothetical protein [Polyangiaceae bacterium]